MGDLIVLGYLALGFVPMILANWLYFKDTAAAKSLLFRWLFSTFCVLSAFAISLLLDCSG